MVTKGYGLSVDDIDWSCPADLEPYAKAYNLETREKDTLMHTMGLYNKIAYEVVMAHFGAGLAGKKCNEKYIEKPFMQKSEEEEYKKNQDRKEYKGMTKEEKEKAELNKAIAYFDSLKARF